MEASKAGDGITWQSEYVWTMLSGIECSKPQRFAGSLADPLKGFPYTGAFQSVRQVIFFAFGNPAGQDEDIILRERFANERFGLFQVVDQVMPLDILVASGPKGYRKGQVVRSANLVR